MSFSQTNKGFELTRIGGDLESDMLPMLAVVSRIDKIFSILPLIWETHYAIEILPPPIPPHIVYELYVKILCNRNLSVLNK